MRRKGRFWPGRFDLAALRAIRTVRQFDEAYTAPHFGFAGAEDYYHRASAMRVIDRIGIHREIEPFLNVPASLMVCVGLTVVGYRVRTGFPVGAGDVSHHLIGVALSMLLIGPVTK